MSFPSIYEYGDTPAMLIGFGTAISIVGLLLVCFGALLSRQGLG